MEGWIYCKIVLKGTCLAQSRPVAGTKHGHIFCMWQFRLSCVHPPTQPPTHRQFLLSPHTLTMLTHACTPWFRQKDACESVTRDPAWAPYGAERQSIESPKESEGGFQRDTGSQPSELHQVIAVKRAHASYSQVILAGPAQSMSWSPL